MCVPACPIVKKTKQKALEKLKKKSENRKERGKKISNLAASHPSVKGQRPQKRWIGVYTGNHRCPVPSFGFGPHPL